VAAICSRRGKGFEKLVLAMFIALFEPTVIPGLDRAILELAFVFTAVAVAMLVLTVSSIIGIVRGIRRRRRGLHSRSAIALALTASSIAALWLLYWVADGLYHRTNPWDGLLAINLSLCLLPFFWLVTAIRANKSA
jgi:hypothetical protein